MAYHFLIRRKIISLITALKMKTPGNLFAINEMNVDKNKNLWLATLKQGLVFFNTQTGLFTRYPARRKRSEWIGKQLLCTIYL